MKILWKVTLKDIIAIAIISVLLAYVFFIGNHQEEFLFYKEMPYASYMWDSSKPPEYLCETKMFMTSCKWHNVPVGIDNAYAKQQYPSLFFVYKNQTLISLIIIGISALVFIFKKKNPKVL
jgi:hypothetical protein